MKMSKYKMYVIFALLSSFSLQAQITDNIIVVKGVGEVTIDNTEGCASMPVQ